MWPTVSDTANCKNRCNNGGNKHIVVWLHWAGSWEAAAFFKDWIRSTHGMIWFTRHKPAWLNSGVQQHTRGSGVKWAKQEIREIVGWKCHWQGWSRSSSCTDSILKKKRSAEHDAHVVPAWCATQDELVKIMDFVPSYSVQGALNHRCCVCRCWFLIVPISLAWHVSQAESVVAPTPAALSPSEFIKHPTESYPLQPYSALHPIDWDLPGLGWSLYNPLWESSPLRQISRDCR